MGGGLRLGAIDGTVTRMPDTAANRAAFGTAGQAETGYPQIRHLHVSDAFTRATLAVVCGPAGGDKAGTKGEAEQALLDRMLAEQPQVFTPDRLWIMDRNFPGVPRIAALLATGSHVLVRVKSDCAMRRSVISPAQRGEMGGISLDPMAYPAPKGKMGTIACQETSGHAQAYGVTR